MGRLDARRAVRGVIGSAPGLKRGRDCLFVTNTAGFAEALGQIGFTVRREGKITKIDPGEGYILEYERQKSEPPDRLAGELLRFRGMGKPDVALFTACLRAADEGVRDEKVERRVRAGAAVALRRGGGGGLYGCACLLFEAGQST